MSLLKKLFRKVSRIAVSGTILFHLLGPAYSGEIQTIKQGNVIKAFNLPKENKTMSLKKGWNLVSGIEDLEGILSNTYIKSAWGWQNNNWEVALPDEEDKGEAYAQYKEFNLLNEIKPNKGYWINAKEPMNINISDGEQTDSEISLTSGWNLVGFSKEMTIENFLQLPEINKKNINSIWGWEENNWKVYLSSEDSKLSEEYAGKKGFGVLEKISLGKGYWVENGSKYAGNTKNKAMYSNKQVFLISDKNWKEVLSLVPLTTWTAQDDEEYKWCEDNGHIPYLGADKVCAFPTLIYHEETDSFDADSGINFIQQYAPSKVIIFNKNAKMNDYIIDLLKANNDTDQQKIRDDPNSYVGAGLKDEQIEYLEKNDLLKHWASFKDVVYVEDDDDLIDGDDAEDYEKALVASTYASLINAPLIIEKYNDDVDLSGKNVICVGDVEGIECNEKYSLEELQKKYKEITGTNKFIMTDHTDLSKYSSQPFEPDKSQTINKSFRGFSLSSPFLASAKHELIIPVKGQEDYKKVDEEFTEKIGGFLEEVSNEEIEYEVVQGEQDSQGYIKDSEQIILGFNNLDQKKNYMLEFEASSYLNYDNEILINDQKVNEFYSYWAYSKHILSKIHSKFIKPTTKIGIKLSDTESKEGQNLRIKDIIVKGYFPDSYLTIISAPNSIPMDIGEKEADSNYYGDLENDGYIDFYTGRITGITVSDASAYIARDLFFDDLKKNKNALMIEKELYGGWTSSEKNKELFEKDFHSWGKIKIEFDNYEICFGKEECTDESVKESYLKNSIIHYIGHGNKSGFHEVIQNKDFKNVYLNNPVILNSACLTCDIGEHDGSGNYNNPYISFCLQNMRRGAIIFNGAVGISYRWGKLHNSYLEDLFIYSDLIGEADNQAKNNNKYKEKMEPCVLLADPTFKPKWWD